MAKENKKKAEDLQAMDDQELRANIENETIRLRKLHFTHSVNPLENPLTIRALRRSIARMKTEQTRRALGAK